MSSLLWVSLWGLSLSKNKSLKRLFVYFKKIWNVFQVNIYFFLITVWKLAQKLSSLNPDLNSLQKIRWVITNLQAAGDWLLCMRAFALARVCARVCNMELNFLSLCFSDCHKNCSIQADIRIFSAPCRAFTITAVAQLCVLGTMWIFGCFQFGENTIIMSYLFTIFGSLQGVMLFVMHCLFSKQVGHNPLSKTNKKKSATCVNQYSVLVFR